MYRRTSPWRHACLSPDIDMTRVADETDVLIIGGGPAGLSAAIRLKQLCKESGSDLRVVVVEKAAEMGGHTLSGAVLEPRALNELLPDWRDRGVGGAGCASTLGPCVLCVRDSHCSILVRLLC